MKDYTAKDIRNIGIFGHGGEGKTTLTEAMLYGAGAIRTMGRVDHGDAFLDTDRQERARGITIFSKESHCAKAQFPISVQLSGS